MPTTQRPRWVETEFYENLDPLGETDGLRARFRTRQGRVDRFTVQYEATFGGRVYAVVGYGSAHGVAHRDLLAWDGSVVTKDWFPDEPFGTVMTRAIRDVRPNRSAYRAWFERRRR